MKLPLVMIGALALCGCNAINLPQAGHYEGNIIHLEAGRLEKLPVRAELTDSVTDIKLDLAHLDRSAYSKVSLHKTSSNEIQLNVTELQPDSITLKRDKDCYTSSDRFQVKLCLAQTEILIEVSNLSGKTGAPLYSLTLDYFPTENAVAPEQPKALTLTEAMHQAFTMNFSTRIEFERTQQARSLAKNAYLNLIPHLSLGSAMAVAQLNPYGIIAVIGDLAPFLLPSRWLHAKQEAELSKAQRDALTLMRGDTGVQVEAFAYALARDTKISAAYKQMRQEFIGLKTQVQWREHLGDFPRGSADNLESTIRYLRADSDAIDLGIEEQKAYVGQTLGLINPKAVLDVALEEELLPVEKAVALDEKDFFSTVLDRAFELRQLEYVMAAAKTAKSATYFEWLDPSGDPTAGLGAGLFAGVAVKDSDVKQLTIAHQQIQSILLQKTSNTIGDYNESIEDFSNMSAVLKLKETHIQEVQDLLKFSRDVSLLDLVTAMQDRLLAQVNVESARVTFRMNRAKLDRLMLQGFYSQLATTP